MYVLKNSKKTVENCIYFQRNLHIGLGRYGRFGLLYLSFREVRHGALNAGGPVTYRRSGNPIKHCANSPI